MSDLKIAPMVSSSVPVATQPNKQESEKKTDFIKKNGKKLLALGAVALATVAAAGIAIYKNKNVPNSLSLNEFKKIGKFDKGTASVKGKLFTGEIINFSKDGKYKFTLKYQNGNLIESIQEVKNEIADAGVFSPVLRKTYSQTDGTRTIKQYLKDIHGEILASTTQIKDGESTTKAKGYLDEIVRKAKKGQDGKWIVTKEFTEPAFIENDKLPIGVARRKKINVNTGEIIDSKIFLEKSKIKEVKIRQTQNGVTTINGKTLATKTQTIDEKGNKIITVDYGKSGKKIITISPDGKRTVNYNTIFCI